MILKIKLSNQKVRTYENVISVTSRDTNSSVPDGFLCIAFDDSRGRYLYLQSRLVEYYKLEEEKDDNKY